MRAAWLICVSFLVACGSSSSTEAPAKKAPDKAEEVPKKAEEAPDKVDSPAGAGFTVKGSVKGSAPAGAELGVLWTVMTGEDRSYNFGTGTVQGSSFVLTLAGSQPPDVVLNDLGAGRFAIGLPVLVAAGTKLTQAGVVDLGAIEAAIVGVAARHAVVWRHGSVPEKIGWLEAFKTGIYQCGVCADDPDSETFDKFAPAACESVEIEVGAPDDLDICNWT